MYFIISPAGDTQVKTLFFKKCAKLSTRNFLVKYIIYVNISIMYHFSCKKSPNCLVYPRVKSWFVFAFFLLRFTLDSYTHTDLHIVHW